MFHVPSQQQWVAAATPVSRNHSPCQASIIVRVVASVLEKLIGGNCREIAKSPSKYAFLKFQSSYPPEVSIEAYLERIHRYSRCSDGCFVMALVYIDKLIENKDLVLTSLNVHRLLVTSVMLAAKFHDDLFYNNAYYSKLGGLSLQELNLLEIDMLHHMNFSLHITSESYSKYHKQLQNYVFYLDACNGPVPPVAPVVTNAMVDGSYNVHTQNYQYLPRVPSPDNPHAKAHSGYNIREDLFSIANSGTNLYQHLHGQQNQSFQLGGVGENNHGIPPFNQLRSDHGKCTVSGNYDGGRIDRTALDEVIPVCCASNSGSIKSGYTTVDSSTSLCSPSLSNDFHGARSINTMSTAMSGRFSPDLLASTCGFRQCFTQYGSGEGEKCNSSQKFVPDYLSSVGDRDPFANFAQRSMALGNGFGGVTELRTSNYSTNIQSSCSFRPRPPSQSQLTHRFSHVHRHIGLNSEFDSISSNGPSDDNSYCMNAQNSFQYDEMNLDFMNQSCNNGSVKYGMGDTVPDTCPPCFRKVDVNIDGGNAAQFSGQSFGAAQSVPVSQQGVPYFGHSAAFAPVYMESSVVHPGSYYRVAHENFARVAVGSVCLGNG